MLHEHKFDNSNGVCVYDFKRQPDNTFLFRGILPKFKEGDKLRLGPSMGFNANSDFEFIEITSIVDSGGKFKNPEHKIKSLVTGMVKQVVN